MQSGYGVSEMQQFMAETGSSPFSISTADIHLSPQAPRYPPPHHHHHHYYQQQHYHQHPLLHPHPHHQQQPPSPPPQPQPQRFPHFHPITQQLFQQTHQFQLFQEEQQRRIQQQPHHHHHHLGLDQDSGPENSSSPTRILGGGASGPPFLGGMNFTLAVNGSCDDGTGSKEGLNDEEGILQEGNRPESHVHQWPREEESTIKEPFWRPLDIDSGNKKKGKEKLENYNIREHCRTSKEGSDSASNYKLFSELEAICKLGVNNASSGGANHQAGSGSALTGENPPVIETELGPDCTPNIDVADRRSDTSTDDEERSLKKAQKSSGSSSRRKRKRKQQLSSISTFFESLLKQLMDHQEGLHRKFLEALERRDQERMKREEAWRQQEAAKSNRESVARAQEQALAFTREAAIMSFLEKITGESLDLLKKPQFESQFSGESQMEEHKSIEPSDDFNNSNINQGSMNNTSRWPKAEVQALIRVRSSFELRFQEPGLKGPLWEEVSSTMASMGYHRSAKRCKEKWENINKYFRKTKDSVKKRTQFSKSCTYFHQLDQLYSKSLRRTLDSTADISHQPKDNSELLDAIVVSTDPASFNFPEMGSLRSDFNGKNNEDVTGISVARQGFLELGEREDGNAQDNEYGEDEEEEEEGGEGGGGGENEEHELDLSNSKGPRQAEENRHDSTLFFCRRLDS